MVLFLSIIEPCNAQQEASVWYFGRNAGVSFSSSGPTVLSDGQIYTDEGVASICDANGSLLFYTDGTKIWNSQHSIMPNGQGLLGSFSSSQSAIIVPKINDPQRYYVFTVAQLGAADGFNYSIVNMALDNGRGDVESKNVFLQSPVCEKLTAVRHCNGRDIWVIVHAFNSAAFHAYLVSGAGISTSAVISTAGTFVSNSNGDNAIGCMKASPDGKKVAIAHKRVGVDLLDFDNLTGVVSNSHSLFLPSEPYGSYRGAYGVEFSPDSKLLYVSADYFDFTELDEFSIVLQYNVSLPDINSIRASKQIIYRQQAYWFSENFGTLQTAPDGKIYMAEMNQPFISVINFPNSEGTACQFVHAQLQTTHNNGGQSMYGLPSFIQSYWKPGFTFRGACNGSLLFFDYERAAGELSVKWDFGDPTSGANNISLLDSSQHLFSSEGIYVVKLIRFTTCGSDTISKQVNVGGGQVNLGNDTTLCGISQFIITSQTSGTNNSYLWQDGSTNSVYTATQSGLYWLEVTNNINGCRKRDSIVLTFKPTPQFNLGNDLHKCEGETATLSATVAGAQYIWNTGSTGNSIQVTQGGLYWLEVSLNGCSRRDSVNVDYNQYPIIQLGKDTVLCEGSTLRLDAKNAGMQYRWQDLSTNQTYIVSSKGTYWVTVNNNNCIASDTINIQYLDKPQFSLGNDTSICQNMSVVLRPKIYKGSDLNYSWSNGSTNSSISVSQQNTYSLTINNQCGASIDEIIIKKGVCQIYVPSAFTPNNDGLNDVLKALFGENLVDFNFQIYNRWGEVVFLTKNINAGWDGKYKGQLQDSGVYVWLIRYKTINDTNEKIMKGTIMLIR